jgi:hypothetical protein
MYFSVVKCICLLLGWGGALPGDGSAGCLNVRHHWVLPEVVMVVLSICLCIILWVMRDAACA